MIALTWDDGPDMHTLALARYLNAHRITGTFFVVGSWIEGVSDDPGEGPHITESGHEVLPVLGEIVTLGHRLGNHTRNHVILREARGPSVVGEQLRANQRALDPFLTNELRLFRAPGGGWGSFAADIVDSDPYLSLMVGPIRWDIDRKDWEHSVRCDEAQTQGDCEPHPRLGRLRTKASVVAARYLETIERVDHGIVLLHDRVGDVGSTYALDIAKALVPKLEARGFVFAAPTLLFGPLVTRLTFAQASARWESLALADINGDGRDDVCGREQGTHLVRCARSVRAPAPADRAQALLVHTRFDSPAIAPAKGTSPPIAGGAANNETRFGDLNGDGRSDRCSRSQVGDVSCALSTGHAFTTPSVWLRGLERWDAWQLGDINGDKRADLCAMREADVACALAP